VRENILKLTDKEIEFIKNSLRRSSQRGEDEERVAEQAGNAEAAAFYRQLAKDATSLLLVIEVQVAKPDEDSDECPECGEDYGYCQCEDEEN